MRAFLEIWSAAGPALVPRDEDRVTLGRGPSNDVCLADDLQVSRLHALLECFAAGWSVRDLGSANGTFVNGERLLAEHRLADGDELRVGETRLVFRNLETEESDETEETETDAVEASAGETTDDSDDADEKGKDE